MEMNKTTKKYFIIASLLILVIVCALVIYNTCIKKDDLDFNNGPEYDEAVANAIKSGEYPMTIYVYGEDIVFPYDVETVNLKSIQSFQEKITTEYNVLVINDYDGKADLTEEDIKYISQFVNKEKNYLLCIGERYFDRWLPEDVTSSAGGTEISRGHYLKRGHISTTINIVEASDYTVGIETRVGSHIMLGLYLWLRDTTNFSENTI